jgi:hypothetical protein
MVTGPFAMTDIAGLDVTWRIRKVRVMMMLMMIIIIIIIIMMMMMMMMMMMVM